MEKLESHKPGPNCCVVDFEFGHTAMGCFLASDRFLVLGQVRVATEKLEWHRLDQSRLWFDFDRTTLGVLRFFAVQHFYIALPWMEEGCLGLVQHCLVDHITYHYEQLYSFSFHTTQCIHLMYIWASVLEIIWRGIK